MAKSSTKPGVKKTEGTLTESGLVIQNIVIRPTQRNQIDIEKWRNYHKAAEGINGTRVALYDLYTDVLLDGFLKRLVAKRVLGVTKKKLRYIDKSGKDVEQAEDFLKKQQFRKLRQYIQLQKAWGISVIEIYKEGEDLKVFDVPKKHIRPSEGLIVYEQLGIEGLNYKAPPYNRTIIEVGEYDELGYLLEACGYAIYKRGNIADWANFAQIFGMPFREARYDGFNEQVRIQLENALENAGSAAYAVLPRDAEMTFHETSGTAGSTTLYETLRTAMNQEMTVHILGATETTTSSKSSGYAQSKTHMETVDELTEDDQEDELTVLNEKVLDTLIYLGFLPKGGRFVYDEPIETEEAKGKVEIAVKLKGAGVPVGDDYFYEVSGIPKPEDYDTLKAEMQAEKDARQEAFNGSKPPKKDKKPGKKMSAAEQENWWNNLRKNIADFFDPAP